MIQWIKLINFQDHIDSTFNFTEGVNSIVGQTDAGKTASIRALRWVVFNRPVGTKYINHGAFVDGKQVKDCVVTVQTDKHIVERRRGASKNSYTLDGHEFNVVKFNVPDEVMEALNFEDINIQFQLDSPFLLTESSGEVARTMNKIVKLDDIDACQKNINGYRLKLNREETSLLYEIKQLKIDVEELDYTEIEKTVETVELLEDKKSNLDGKIDLIKSLIYDIIDIDEVLESEKALLACEDKLNKICEEYRVHKQLSNEISNLRDIIYDIEDIDGYIEDKQWVFKIDVESLDTLFSKYTELKSDIRTISGLIEQYEALVDAEYAKINVEAIDKVYTEYKKLSENIESIGELVAKLEKVDTVIEAGEEKVNTLEAELAEEMKGTCPLCGAEIGEECV